MYDFEHPGYHLSEVMRHGNMAAQELTKAFVALLDAVCYGAEEYDDMVFLDDAKKALMDCLESVFQIQISVEAIISEINQKNLEEDEEEETAGD